MFAWSTYTKINNSPGSSHELLRDLEQYLTPQQFRYYAGFEGLTTKLHECTHGVHANIRNSLVRLGYGHVNAFYVYNGYYVWFYEPNFKKSQIAEFVPKHLKNHHLYRTYIVGSEAWENEPLYPWDEATAYVNGAQAGHSMSEIEFALVFGFFLIATLRACKKYDPAYLIDYSLTNYLDYTMLRLDEITNEYGKSPHKTLLKELKKHRQEYEAEGVL